MKYDVAVVALAVVDAGWPGQFLGRRRCKILGSETCRSSQLSVEFVTVLGSGLTLQGLEDGGQLFVGDDDRNCWSGNGLEPNEPTTEKRAVEWFPIGPTQGQSVKHNRRRSWLVGREGDYSRARGKVFVRE